MTNRWTVLVLLFTVRLAMAFQFQAVGAVSPVYMQRFGVNLSDIGLLISLYLAPGLVFAVPGGEIGRRFGDKRVVLIGLGLMIVGGLIMAFSETWSRQLAGRLIAGLGGVLLNVLMSKMVTDWFAGREIATAMGIFVNSWPAGIALALVLLPPLAASGGVVVVAAATIVFAVIGLALLWLLYAPPGEQSGAPPVGEWPVGAALKAVVAAGTIWGLYNAALGMIFGYGTAMLVERGWSLSAAGSVTSLVLWMVAISVPLGGLIADRTGRIREVMLVGFACFAVVLPIAARTDDVLLWFVILGLVGGISAGPIMSLPSRVLTAQARAVGMGLYFAMQYLAVVVGPIIAGQMAELAGTSRITFDFGAAMLAACFVTFWFYERLLVRQTAETKAMTSNV
jgi:MFS family permease